MVCQARKSACTFDQKPPSRPARSQSGKNRQLHQQPNETIARSWQVYRSLAPSTEAGQLPLVQPGVGSGSATVNQSPASSSASSYQSPLVAESLTEVLDFQMLNPHVDLSASISRRDGEDNDGSLELTKSKFAELYGLTSDMEPILMQRRPYDFQSHEFRLENHSIQRVLREDMGMQYPVAFPRGKG
ncbi:hypothetical protein BBP40_006649 [Aspergillus hancockii]|nr:hypothetical protein BBP40_006649 [Aspergillus hancockii]